MARGYDAKAGRDGLIVFRPKRRKARLPLRGLAILAITPLCFKGLVLMKIGDLAYQARVDALTSGSMAEQIGGYLLQIDPVTRFLAGQFAALF